jgi:hypothetical protein
LAILPAFVGCSPQYFCCCTWLCCLAADIHLQPCCLPCRSSVPPADFGEVRREQLEMQVSMSVAQKVRRNAHRAAWQRCSHAGRWRPMQHTCRGAHPLICPATHPAAHPPRLPRHPPPARPATHPAAHPPRLPAPCSLASSGPGRHTRRMCSSTAARPPISFWRGLRQIWWQPWGCQMPTRQCRR